MINTMQIRKKECVVDDYPEFDDFCKLHKYDDATKIVILDKYDYDTEEGTRIFIGIDECGKIVDEYWNHYYCVADIELDFFEWD